MMAWQVSPVEKHGPGQFVLRTPVASFKKGACRKDRGKLFNKGSSERTRGNGFKWLNIKNFL